MPPDAQHAFEQPAGSLRQLATARAVTAADLEHQPVRIRINRRQNVEAAAAKSEGSLERFGLETGWYRQLDGPGGFRGIGLLGGERPAAEGHRHLIRAEHDVVAEPDLVALACEPGRRHGRGPGPQLMPPRNRSRRHAANGEHQLNPFPANGDDLRPRFGPRRHFGRGGRLVTLLWHGRMIKRLTADDARATAARGYNQRSPAGAGPLLMEAQ